MPSMSTAETLRSREVYRYYQPKSVDGHIPEPIPVRHDQAHGPHFLPKVTNFNTQQSFSDTALTAFAQLIALRLTAQRAIVSLIDHENEYFLAESTSTLSVSDDDSAQNAWLSISGARVARGQSLCEQTLRLKPNQDTTAEMTPWYLVPDLQLDEKMSTLDCVKGVPYLRFYCGVPLTNLNGVNIGCVYVVDDRPRTDFSLEQAQFMTKMAATVMDHLEGIRAKEDIVRVTMMSQALHAFIEGDGTMDGDWQRLKRYNLPSGAGVGFQWQTNRDDGTGSFRNGQKQLGKSRNLSALVGTSPVESPLQHTFPSPDARFNFNNSPWSSSSEVPQVPHLKSVFHGIDDPASQLAGRHDDEFANNGFATRLHDTFSRASNLVREGMEVDGAVFFDAPFRFYQGRRTLEMDPRRSEDQESLDESDTDSDPDTDGRSGARPGPNPLILPSGSPSSMHSRHTKAPERRGASSNVPPTGLKSDILGFSTRHSSSLNHATNPPRTFTAIDHSLLTSLVKTYPLGELFVFDRDGPISPDSAPNFRSRDCSVVTIVNSVTEEKRARRAARKRADILRLLVAFPGARQIFFVPLYDSTSGCFIGSFAWSTSATRIFTAENHLSYLVAFGHSVMSEVSRLNTLSADRAKGDFISNVSHELRSPLHGVLASVEFLADTVLDGFQRNLVETVDICGRTLLDTIEHVLDFSKIKKFGQASMQPMGVVADLDVSAVIEEVLEGVYSGFEFNGLASEGLADTTRSRTRDVDHAKDTADNVVHRELPTVIIDVDFRSQWKFPTVPGTWRRLTMNIFGNALKYTPSGYIKVKISAHAMADDLHTKKAGAVERTMVTLTVTDSGKGMSKEFMEKKMFMPFSQEDVTAPGTGLGMSIVKQIVDLSGGAIDIKSDQNTGTEITLSLPLENCAPPSKDNVQKSDSLYTSEDPVVSVRRRAGGRTISILGFDDISGKSRLECEALFSLKASIAKYATEWFGFTLVDSTGAADIAISDESVHNKGAVSTTSHRVLLILCSNGARRDIFLSLTHTGQIVEFVSKPCGPHRLAKAFLNCLDAEDGTPYTPMEERSSIEFAPTALNSIHRSPTLTKTRTPIAVEPKPADTRPLLTRRVESSATTIDAEGVKALDGLGLRSRGQSSTEDFGESSEATSGDNSGDSSNVSGESVAETGQTTPPSSSTSYPEDPNTPIAPRRPVMLLVEDNPVNMMLLATYMKKNNWEFEKATNGLLALEAFRRRPGGFDVIFMDVSMPVMTGYEATRHIRNLETERRLAYDQQSPMSFPIPTPISSFPSNPSPGIPSATSPNGIFPTSPPPASAFDPSIIDRRMELPKSNSATLIIALTGFSSEKDQEMAFQAGVDIFMTKPVRFREVGKILEGWMNNREQRGGEEDLLGLGGGGRDGNRVVNEDARGAERSG
ncbi:hypothetical protein LZ554_003695 [Drepanopeziza brunnea f. sp. 'monogermtubi']|nr:hypothetical protein LZ554_003695 [Drepanopeziza brunnea f. sp. 'monogermtubi']